MSAVKLVLFDVDGVLTDGSLHIGAAGEVVKTFNVRDGVAVALLHAHGLRCGVVSGRSSPALDERIRQLDFDVAITGRNDKLAAVTDMLSEMNLEPDETAFVGDDIIDLSLAGHVGKFYAPADAHPLVLARADHVVRANGGHGVAREVAEHVLQLAGIGLAAAYSPLLSDGGVTRIVQ